MPTRHILIVAIDGLRASALGAYGNTTFPTPALDEFAAESFLLDSCYAPSADLGDVYRACWQSVHPARPLAAEDAAPSLPRRLASRGYSTTLVTDDASSRDDASTAAAGMHVQHARPLYQGGLHR